MRILALDTATENCSAALYSEGRFTARERLVQRGHAEIILPMIDEVLREGGTALGSIDAIAFGRGPGSFTGVRLAASVTQGLAYGAGLPVVPISDLRAIAQRLFGTAAAAARVLVCNDARMREVYWACFERGPGGIAAPAGEEHVGAPGAVAVPPGWHQGEEVRGAGTGFAAYPELKRALATSVHTIEPGLYPRATEIALLAAPEILAGRVRDAAEALPVYLRDQVAQRPPAHS